MARYTLPYAPCGYVGSQFRSAYEGSTSLNGAGVTDRHKDRISEPALRFHNMLKFRLFGLNE